MMRSARTSFVNNHAVTATLWPFDAPLLLFIGPAALVVLLLLLSTVPGTHAHESLCHVCGDNDDTNVTSVVCQTLSAAADLLTNLTYSEEICAGIQYRGVTANCCDTPANFCNLCEEGGRLPDPDQKVSALTCSQIGGLASFLDSEASCEVFQATYGVYCGCDNPIASANACRICGDDVPLEHRTLVSAPEFQKVPGAPARRFCGALEFFAQYSIDPLPNCAAYQTQFGASCCGGEGGEPVTDDSVDQSTDIPSSSGATSVTSSPIMAPTTSTTSTTAAPVAASAGNMTSSTAPAAAAPTTTTTNGTAPLPPGPSAPAEAPGTVPSPVTPANSTPLVPPPSTSAATACHTTTLLLALVGWTMLIN